LLDRRWPPESPPFVNGQGRVILADTSAWVEYDRATGSTTDNDIGSDAILLREPATGLPGIPCVTRPKER
jgi:hypothetical protein